MNHCKACKGYGRVAPKDNPEAPATEYVLCRKCGGLGREKPKGPPDYHATFTPLSGGRLVMLASDEENARPWVNLLTRAGVTLEHMEPAGRYVFTFAGAEELVTAKTPAEVRPYHWLDQVEAEETAAR